MTTIVSTYLLSSASGIITNRFKNMIIDITLHNAITNSLKSLTTLLTNTTVLTKSLGHVKFNNLIKETDIQFKLDLINGFMSDLLFMTKPIHLDQNNLTNLTYLTDNDNLTKSTLSTLSTITDVSSNSLNSIEIINHNTPNPNSCQTLSIGLKYISESINNLYELINQTNNMIIHHQTKYFSYYRILDLTKQINNIKSEHDLLMNRFNVLIKMI